MVYLSVYLFVCLHNLLVQLLLNLSNDFEHFQIEYAANDAMVGVDIFFTLVLAKMWNRKPDVRVEKIFKHIDETEFWKFTSSIVQGTVDANYTGPANSKNPSYRPPTVDDEVRV